jgi:protein subunit release factor A
LAERLQKVSKQNLESTEDIKTKILPKDEIILKLKNQEIRSAVTIAALFYGHLLSNYSES